MEALTQSVECGNVLPHVSGLVGTRLPHQSVHIMSEAEARHLRWVHVNCEKVLMTAKIHLERDGQMGKVQVWIKVCSFLDPVSHPISLYN